MGIEISDFLKKEQEGKIIEGLLIKTEATNRRKPLFVAFSMH